MKLTNDQEQVLQEIPGYVRKDMIERWIRYYLKRFNNPESAYEDGFVGMIMTLEHDLRFGVLNNDKDMREC